MRSLAAVATAALVTPPLAAAQSGTVIAPTGGSERVAITPAGQGSGTPGSGFNRTPVPAREKGAQEEDLLKPLSTLRQQALVAAGFDDYNNVVFLEDYPTDLIGFGFYYDPLFGEWVMKKPIADLSITPDPSTVPVTSTIQYEDYVTNSLKYSSQTTTFDLQTTLGLTKIGASLAFSSASENKLQSNSFALTWLNYYGLQLAEFVSTPPAFTTEAQEIIDEYDAANIAGDEIGASDAINAWRDKFGDYIAVGTDALSSISLKVTVSQSSSYDASDLFASLKAKYAATSASASFVSAIEDSFASSEFSFGLEGVGVNVATINLPFTPDDIDTSEEKNAFLNSLGGLLQNSPTEKGILLIPISSFPEAPPASLTPLNSFLIGQAATEASLALKTLSNSEDYRRNANLNTYLQAQSPPSLSIDHPVLADLLLNDAVVMEALGSPAPSFASFLDAGVVRLLKDFEATYLASTSYVAAKTALEEQQASTALIAASDAMRATRIATDALMTAINFHNQAIIGADPCVEVVLVAGTESADIPGTDGISVQQLVLSCQNCALFTNPWDSTSTLEVITGNIEGQYDKLGANSSGWFNLLLDAEINPITPPQGKMQQWYVDSFTRDPADGLVDLQFRFTFGAFGDWNRVRLTLFDQFGRPFKWNFERPVLPASNVPLEPASSAPCN